jgi:tryptophanyl-tRNA synthetase
MDLQEPNRKMSKSSESPQGTIGLFDDPVTIRRKIRRAVTDTDSGPGSVRYDPAAKPGVSSLVELLATIQGRPPAEVAAGYEQYGPLKEDVADAVVGLVEPIQVRFRELSADPGIVADVLRKGASRAESIALPTLRRAYDAVGLVPPG